MADQEYSEVRPKGERRYTASHWGIYGVETDGNRPKLVAYEGDSDPSPIGFHQLDDDVARLRVRRPAIRKSWLEEGPGKASHLRGREPFVEVTWDVALDLVAKELARIKDRYGNTSIFGGSYGWSSAGRFHHAQSQVHRFLNMIGGYVRSVDTYSLGAGMVILPHVVAPAAELNAMHTSWDVMARRTRLFVAFGGVPLKNTQISSGGAADHRVRNGLHAMGQAGVRFVNISPVRDNLDPGAPVTWMPIRPNTDTALMLALAQTLLSEDLHDVAFLDRYCVGFESFRAYLDGSEDGQPKTPEWAAPITGVASGAIRALARDMAATRTMLNVTMSLQRAAHGEQPFWAVIALACMLGQIGLPGGGFGVGYGAMNSIGSPHPLYNGPVLPQGTNAVREFIPVARIADMLLHPGEHFSYNGGDHVYPHVRLVYWAGGNPYHHHQDLNLLREAWKRPESIFVHEQFWTATAKHADVVLPATTTLERNDIGTAVREGHIVAMRKVVDPVGEARDDFAIFADLSKRLGCSEAYTENLDEEDWLRRLYKVQAASAKAAGIELPDFDTFWDLGVVALSAYDEPVIMLEAFRNDPDKAPLRTPSGRIEVASEKIAGFNLLDCPGHPAWLEPFEWLGAPAARDFPIHLLSDQPSRRLHSQLDHSSHSMAGKINGREPVYMNIGDAASRGISAGDAVAVFNGRGRCLAAAVLTEDVMPRVARMATGAWYDPDEASGVERHGNPNAITLDRGASGLSQGCAAQTCLVEIERVEEDAQVPCAHRLPVFTGS